MTADEIIDWQRGELTRWLEAAGNDVAQHELPEMVDRMMVRCLAQTLASAMICMALTEMIHLDGNSRAISQLYNWGHA